MSCRMSAILKMALSPRSGAEPWQDMPFTSTRISMRPRWPRYTPPSVGSVETTNSGVIPDSEWMYCQQRPSQSSSCTVPVTMILYPSGMRP